MPRRPLLIKHRIKAHRRSPAHFPIQWECAFCDGAGAANTLAQAQAILNVHVAVRHPRLFNLYTTDNPLTGSEPCS